MIMRKRYMTILGSVLVVVCLFLYSPVSYAAQQYPQKTSSASGDVSAYCTIEFRGFETSDFALNSWDNRVVSNTQFQHAQLSAACCVHVSVTLRNRSSKIQVCDLNNFRLSVSGFDLTTSVQTDAFFDFMGIRIQDAVGVDVYDIAYNNSSNSAMAWTVDFRDRNSLVLEPDEQRDYSFDIYIPCYMDTGTPDPAPWTHLNSTTWSSSVWGITQVPSFTGYTIEEYANLQEGWWSYLVRALQKIVNGNQTPYQDSDVVDQGQTVTDNSQAAEQTLEDLHDTETGFYEAADDAIESVDFGSFSYDASTTGGLNWFNDRFTNIWNNLGSFAVVPVFSMLLSLAVMILRHEVSRNG